MIGAVHSVGANDLQSSYLIMKDVNVFFFRFLSLRCETLKYWNNGRYMLLRKWIRRDPSNLVLIAGARALAGNVPGNLSLVAFGERGDGAHNLWRRGGHTET